jgi:hypothetical protein
MGSDKYPKNYWKWLLALIPLYSIAQLIYYLPTSYFPAQINKFPLSPVWILIPIIFLTGWWILYKMEVGWMLAIWKWVHVSIIGIVLIILVGNKAFDVVPLGILSSVRPMIEFLISPIFYIALGIMYRIHKFKGL